MPSLLITTCALSRAVRDVKLELKSHRLYSRRLKRVKVFLYPIAVCYGWQYYGTSGHIAIPSISLMRLWGKRAGFACGLRDVLRHEFGHAIADKHRALFRDEFRRVFRFRPDYDPDAHVSLYASTNSHEDFAEVFMNFLKFKGNLPGWWDKPAIRRKWRFIQKLKAQL